MNILLMLIPVALILVTIAVWFFFWAIKSEQFDDLDRQGANILFDEDLHEQKKQQPTSPKANDSEK
ncbi:MAG: cbb3-type cytochrome oxidase assembly protein CcoS [Gammaproteobacteria bacterium]|nr:cbb3-type cytochrome oxidase assembly protein CcoS [Gammaproteobacteria bacterium]